MPNFLSQLPRLVQSRKVLAREVFSRLGHNRAGATMIEYCIIIGLIAIVVVAAFSQIGQFPTSAFEEVGSHIG